MGTTIDGIAVAAGRWPLRGGARRLADLAVRASVTRAGVSTRDIDLLLNAGLYRERILGEPALAAMIQADVGANPEDPHDGAHGTFSFDVANGACGPLTALQIADGFLRAGTIERALVVASDANPGRGLAPGFPFASSGAAVVCRWDDRAAGLVGFRWEQSPMDSDLLRARVGFERGRNVLRIERDPGFGDQAAAWAGKAGSRLLTDYGVDPDEVDLVVASPLTAGFLGGLPAHLGVPGDRVVTVPVAVRVHTAGLLVALAAAERQGRLGEARRVLLVSAGAGIVAGAALLAR
ncbi:MAG TPA: 3-oxoacyl-[acyl-carrier-protein] synthase III C-terminal domain-containing protein [Actinomycetota bacterium]|jgi:3-oxoacyl-[acyl-carrier-protein] synthase-3|nr:3-oxoacyl-[acyl-carrier-protein] synthase III C-terminal domain-containing protein [Actinomycetota bacterium]